MKTLLSILLGFIGAATLAAQAPSGGEPALRTSGELDELLAPIALYPDALVALILPASTVPADIALAASYLAANGDPAQIAGQPWDDSVKSLAHYPDVVRWMNDNAAWTVQLGGAFAAQPADVMKSIQQLRARAIAAGTLRDTPQQRVLTDGGEIRIVPAQPSVLYVPRYDPNLVYEEQLSYAGPWLTFGPGFPIGAWLNYDLNWEGFGIWIGTWHPGFDYRHPQWRHPPGHAPVAGRPWQPTGRRPEPVFAGGGMRPPEIAHPQPLPGGPRRTIPPTSRPPAAPVFRATGQYGSVQPESRGYPPSGQGRQAVAKPAPPSGAFGGYNRGSDARSASERGRTSRQSGSPERPSAPQPSRSSSSPSSSSSSTSRSSSSPGDTNRWK